MPSFIRVAMVMTSCDNTVKVTGTAWLRKRAETSCGPSENIDSVCGKHHPWLSSLTCLHPEDSSPTETAKRASCIFGDNNPA